MTMMVPEWSSFGQFLGQFPQFWRQVGRETQMNGLQLAVSCSCSVCLSVLLQLVLFCACVCVCMLICACVCLCKVQLAVSCSYPTLNPTLSNLLFSGSKYVFPEQQKPSSKSVAISYQWSQSSLDLDPRFLRNYLS